MRMYKKLFLLTPLIFSLVVVLRVEQRNFRVVAFDIGSGASKMSIGRLTAVCLTTACVEARPNIKIGSNSVSYFPNTQVIKADLESIETEDLKSSYEVPYGNQVKNDRDSDGTPDGFIDEATRTSGIAVIRQMIQLADREKEMFEAANPTAPQYTDFYVGVTTSALRTFQENYPNEAKAFIENIKAAGLRNFAIIRQGTEAAMGFLAAITAAEIEDPRNTLVWDIGGNSTQVVAADADGDVQVVALGHLASNAFRKLVVDQVKRTGWMHQFPTITADFLSSPENESFLVKNNWIVQIGDAHPAIYGDSEPNPNPMTQPEVNQAVLLSKTYALNEGSDIFPINQWLESNPAEKVVGIGGLHKYAGYKRLQKLGLLDKSESTYTQGMMEAGISRMAADQYNDINKYARGDLTNMALILGHMQAWNIDEVIGAGATMADALIHYPFLANWGYQTKKK